MKLSEEIVDQLVTEYEEACNEYIKFVAEVLDTERAVIDAKYYLNEAFQNKRAIRRLLVESGYKTESIDIRMSAKKKECG